MKLLILIFLIPNLSFADENKKKEMIKNLPREVQEVIVLQKLWEIAESQRKWKRTVSPQKIKTDKDGFKFQTKTPLIGEKKSENILDLFKPNPLITRTDLSSETVIDFCHGCFRERKYPPAPFIYKYYPIGSSFIIHEIIALPGRSGLLFILKDQAGNLVSVSDHHVKDLIDGGTGGLQNGQLLLLDILVKGKIHVEIHVKINDTEFTSFKQSFMSKAHWDFPPFVSGVNPKLESLDYEGWLRYAAKGFTGKEPKKFKITNVQNREYDTTFDISADINSFVILLYAKLIEPYIDIKDSHAINDKYRSRYKNNTKFPLGESAASFIERIKTQIK